VGRGPCGFSKEEKKCSNASLGTGNAFIQKKYQYEELSRCKRGGQLGSSGGGAFVGETGVGKQPRRAREETKGVNGTCVGEALTWGGGGVGGGYVGRMSNYGGVVWGGTFQF